MTGAMGLIIILAAGIGALIFFLIRDLIFPKGGAAMAALIKRGKTPAVIRMARALLAKDSRNAEAHYYLGQAYLIEKRAAEAYREFKTLSNLSIQGKDIPEAEYRTAMAKLYLAHGESEEALKEYLLLVKLFPNKGEYYYQAGKIFGERGKTDTAREYFQKALELEPRDGACYFELGMLCYREKRAPSAKQFLEQALRYQKEEDRGPAWFYLGKLQKDLKEYGAALRSFERAAKKDEYQLRSLAERGNCFMLQDDLEAAVPELEKAVSAITDESSPESLYARYYLGLCYEKRQETDRARAQWETVYRMKKNFLDVGEKLTQYMLAQAAQSK
jgi:tetratricopeptide (TPR) repeat protein